MKSLTQTCLVRVMVKMKQEGGGEGVERGLAHPRSKDLGLVGEEHL